MIKIHITEKTGISRELNFDRTTIAIGRSARNDIILPKSNVSKNHATIEYANGKIILKDLGSTNGTFVNGRKITKAVIINPEDNIFISDFTIKAKWEEEDIPEELSGVHEIIEPISEADLEGVTLHGDAPSKLPPVPEEVRLPPKKVSVQISGEEAIKLRENQYDKKKGKIEIQNIEEEQIKHQPLKSPLSNKEICSAIYKKIYEKLELEKFDTRSVENEEFTKKTSRLIAEFLNSTIHSNNIPVYVEPREISDILHKELLGFGPLEQLLKDPAVKDIQITSSGNIRIFTEKGVEVLINPFLCPESKNFIIKKLAGYIRASLNEGEQIITGSTEDGTIIKIVSNILSPDGVVMTIQKSPPCGSITIENLVEKEVLSSKMVALFEQCLQMRKGILIADSLGISNSILIPALAEMISSWERIIVVQCGAEQVSIKRKEFYFKVPVDSSESFTLSRSGENLFSVIPSFNPTAVIISELNSSNLLKSIRHLSNTKTTVIATVKQPTTEDCVEYLKQLVLGEYPQLDPSSAIRMATEGFGLIISFTKIIDGREKITAIHDIQPSKEHRGINIRPIFLFEVKETTNNGEVIGTFKATKTIPWFIEEKRQKGINIDVSIFQ